MWQLNIEISTIIKSDLKYFESGDLPSLTLCRNDYDWQFIGKYKENGTKQIYYQFDYYNEK